MTGATSARTPSRRITPTRLRGAPVTRTDRTYQPAATEVRRPIPTWPTAPDAARGLVGAACSGVPAGPEPVRPAVRGRRPCYTPAVLDTSGRGPRTRRSAIALAGRIGRPERRPSDRSDGNTGDVYLDPRPAGSGIFDSGGALGGRCVRWRLRRSLTHPGVRSLACSPAAFASTAQRRRFSVPNPGPGRSPDGRRLMPATVIVGLQWGDEGKGKTTDFLAEQVAMVVRYQGGDNAGPHGGQRRRGVQAPADAVGRALPAHHVGHRQRRRGQPGDAHRRARHARGARHRRVAGPGQPQRARDHAVPRRARSGQRGPARVGQGRHDRSRDRTDLRRSRLAPRPADGGPPRSGGAARADRTRSSPTRTSLLGAMGRPDLRGRPARRPGDWPGAIGCATTSTTRRGWSRRRSRAASTSCSRAPRARCSTSTTGATRT